jgi:hypothetical protein
MTEDDIMLMALDAGPLTQGPFKDWCKRFAALVAAHEREACAKVCEEIEPFYGVMFANAIRARGTP